jgi:hypothetical protein
VIPSNQRISKILRNFNAMTKLQMLHQTIITSDSPSVTILAQAAVLIAVSKVTVTEPNLDIMTSSNVR